MNRPAALASSSRVPKLKKWGFMFSVVLFIQTLTWIDSRADLTGTALLFAAKEAYGAPSTPFSCLSLSDSLTSQLTRAQLEEWESTLRHLSIRSGGSSTLGACPKIDVFSKENTLFYGTIVFVVERPERDVFIREVCMWHIFGHWFPYLQT